MKFNKPKLSDLKDLASRAVGSTEEDPAAGLTEGPELCELVWKHLSQARWYAGKGRPAELRALTRLPALVGTSSEAGPVLRLEIAEVGHADDGSVHFYLVALLLRGPDLPGAPESSLGVVTDPDLGEVEVHDATADPFAQQLLLSALLGSAEQADENGSARVAAHLTEAAEDPASGIRAGLTPRRFGGEQSNTSIMYAEVAMLKLFRRLEPGDNLDIEVHRALGAGPAAEDVATLFGWLEADWTDSTGTPRHADLGMLVEQLREVRDGWELAVEQAASGTDFSSEAYALGRSLATVHRALAEAFGTGERPATEITEEMTTRLQQAAEIVPELGAELPALRDRFARLGGTTVTTQRVHGDFHLGQTLRQGAPGHAQSGQDASEPVWKIIDFEGEPLKTLAERRAPDSAWRDVAGMLRSFDYAAGFAIRERGTDPELAEQWARRSSAAFLDGYRTGPPSEEQRQIVAAYQVDKAAYEAVYEARNRPDWLPIPLEALRRLGHDQHTPTDPDLGE